MLALFPTYSTLTHHHSHTYHSRGQFNSGSHLVLSLFRLHHTHSNGMPHELFTIGQNPNTSLFLSFSLRVCWPNFLRQQRKTNNRNTETERERENRRRRKNDNKTKRNGMENNQSSKLLSMTDACFSLLSFFIFLNSAFLWPFVQANQSEKTMCILVEDQRRICLTYQMKWIKKDWNISTVNCWTLQFSLFRLLRFSSHKRPSKSMTALFEQQRLFFSFRKQKEKNEKKITFDI